MNRSTVHRIIRGHQEARHSEIERLAVALGVSQGLLLETNPPAAEAN